jgi:hypothetical protein
MPLLTRRPVIVLCVVVFISIVLFAGSHHEPTTMKLEKWLPEIGPNNKGNKHWRATRRRVRALRAKCDQPDLFETMYGRTNIRMSRGYEGALWIRPLLTRRLSVPRRELCQQDHARRARHLLGHRREW